MASNISYATREYTLWIFVSGLIMGSFMFPIFEISKLLYYLVYIPIVNVAYYIIYKTLKEDKK